MFNRMVVAGFALQTFFILNSSFFISTANAVDVDGIAATVGTETILRSDVMNELRRSGAQNGRAYQTVLNEMIDRKLILRAARESKMTMQEWVVENRVREIVKKMFGGDRNKLIEMLGRQKISYPEWYAKTKEDMIIGAMRWNVVDKNATASPTEMRKEYETHKSRYSQDHKVTVSVIMLSPGESDKRESVLGSLKDKTFEELGGRKYEDVKPSDMFKPEIVAEIEKMPKGTISRWVELDGWSFLLRKDDETCGKALSFEEAYDQVEAAVKEASAKRLYLAWVERLRAETFIKVY